jgi:hypothetical protein
MSLVWTATAALVFIAALCLRVLIATRDPRRFHAPGWLAPALLALLLLAMASVLAAVRHASYL